MVKTFPGQNLAWRAEIPVMKGKSEVGETKSRRVCDRINCPKYISVELIYLSHRPQWKGKTLQTVIKSRCLTFKHCWLKHTHTYLALDSNESLGLAASEQKSSFQASLTKFCNKSVFPQESTCWRTCQLFVSLIHINVEHLPSSANFRIKSIH